MKIASLALQTDLMLAGWDGAVDDRGDHVVVSTPSSPGFYFGNFVAFPGPPEQGSAARWIETFRGAFAHDPAIEHVCLRWDSTDGELGAIDPFVRSGFVLDKSVALTATDVQQPARVPAAEIRAIASDDEWAAVTRLQIATAEETHGVDSTGWQTQQVDRYRRFVAAGRGVWLGAFVDGRLAADLGVFVENGVGRFQAVETHPDFRRRGLCAALVHRASRTAFDRLGARVLVLVADPDYHAARVYESVGFRPTQRGAAVYRHAPGVKAAAR